MPEPTLYPMWMNPIEWGQYHLILYPIAPACCYLHPVLHPCVITAVGGLLTIPLCLNLFWHGHAGWGVLVVFLANFLDTWDGVVARACGSGSTFGKYMDETVDLIRTIAVLSCGIVLFIRYRTYKGLKKAEEAEVEAEEGEVGNNSVKTENSIHSLEDGLSPASLRTREFLTKWGPNFNTEMSLPKRRKMWLVLYIFFYTFTGLVVAINIQNADCLSFLFGSGVAAPPAENEVDQNLVELELVRNNEAGEELKVDETLTLKEEIEGLKAEEKTEETEEEEMEGEEKEGEEKEEEEKEEEKKEEEKGRSWTEFLMLILQDNTSVYWPLWVFLLKKVHDKDHKWNIFCGEKTTWFACTPKRDSAAEEEGTAEMELPLR